MSFPGFTSERIYGADTYIREVQIRVDDVAPDLTGFVWSVDVRDSPGSGAVLAAMAVDESDAANGNLTITLTSTQVRSLPATSFYDIQATVGATERTYARVKLIKTMDVTR